MRTKIKNRLTVILILLSFFVISAISITAIFALTQQKVTTEVGVKYDPAKLFTFSDNGDGTVSISSFNVDGWASFTGTLYIPATTTNGETITKIGDSVFNDCDNLKNVVIPNSVTSIGKEAFLNCSKLKSVTFEETSKVTSLGDLAFYQTGLTSIEIPKSVTSIGDLVFGDCANLANITVESGNTIYHSSGNCLIETDSGNLIQGCKTSEIPADGSVTSIGEYAFLGCSELNSITIPNTITSVDSTAFQSCTELKNMTIDTMNESVVSVVNSLANRNGAMNLTIGDSVTSITASAFKDCTGLTGITIPSGVTSIGSNAFSGCSNLTNVAIDSMSSTIVNVIKSLPASTNGLTLTIGIKNLSTIPTATTNVGTFMSGPYIKELIIGDCVKTIGGNAFYNNSKLQKLTLGGSVEEIKSSAFKSCTELEGVIIPDTVTTLGASAFAGCLKLGYLVLGSGLTHISENAFEQCNELINLSIPASVTYIGAQAFLYCENLQYINIAITSSDSYVGSQVFLGISTEAQIRCKIESKPSGWESNWSGSAEVYWGQPM